MKNLEILAQTPQGSSSPTPVRLSAQLGQCCARDWRACFSSAEHASLRAIVRTAMVDTTACVWAGLGEPVSERMASWAGLPALHGPVRADGRHAAWAAMVNATCGHALDYDDVGLAGHPSVVLVPTLMALHDASGVRGFALIEAYAKGYAVWADLQRRMKVHLHGRGWHPTAVFGTLAAAAATASVRGLSELQFTHALGIAASFASGLIANFGSMAKAVQVGRAARAGIEAAELAALGIDASPDALDGPAGLLLALAGPGGADVEASVAPDFESTLLRLRPGIKKYPVCYAAHRAIDGVLDLAKAHRLESTDVVGVDVTLSETTAAVLRHHEPGNLAEARFSLEFVVASALVHAALGPREVGPASLVDPEIGRLMAGVRMHTVDTRCPLEPSFALEDRVRITTRSGAVLDSGPIRFARGHAMLPLDAAQVDAKLLACAPTEAFARAEVERIDAALKDG
jgi:2-methylcitrate dehydratase PrpD